MEHKDYFKNLIGEQLSSVEFVQDYLQLHFDGNTVTFYSWPILRNDRQYSVHDLNYRNKLCGLIGKIVVNVTLHDKVEFEILVDDVKIILPLIRNSSNEKLPEFMYYTDIDKNWLVLD